MAVLTKFNTLGSFWYKWRNRLPVIGFSESFEFIDCVHGKFLHSVCLGAFY